MAAMIIALVALHGLCSVSWACAPSDNDADCERKQYFTEEQMEQMNMDRVRELTGNRAALQAAMYDEVIVKLTPDQEQFALDNYPGMFRTKHDLPDLDNVRINNAPFNFTADSPRQKRQAYGLQKCRPRNQFVALTLGLNYNGDLVQIIQSSRSQQWVVDEQCKTPTDSSGDSCRRTFKSVSLYVADFSSSPPSFEVEYIQIFCCVTFN